MFQGPSQGSQSKAHSPRRSRRISRAVLEVLEPRRLLSTDLVTSLNDSGAGSLRQEIASAAPGDTIQFNAGLSGGSIVLTSGELTISQNLTIIGLGASNLSISGNKTSTIFNITAGANVGISGLTLTAANAVLNNGGGIYNDGTLSLTNCVLSADQAAVGNSNPNPGGEGNGGAIYNDLAGILTLNSTTITTAIAELGAGIYNNGGNVTITSSTISNSDADQGGGILNTSGGIVNITGSTISGNEAQGEAGGGICNENSTLTITGSSVTNNIARTYGGGITNYADGTLTIDSTNIQGNTAELWGGGIFNFTNATLTIQNNTTIASNTVDGPFGGGLYNYEGTATISNSSFTSNVSADIGSGFGGGVANFQGDLNITATTFATNGNFAEEAGGGLYTIGGATTISSSTFNGNDATYGAGILADNGASLIVSASTFENNVAGTEGGGAYIAGTAFFDNTTIAANQSAFGGGLFIVGTVSMTNSTIANNLASSGGGGIYIFQGDTSIYNTIVASNTLTNHTTATNITGALDAALFTEQTHSSNNLVGTGGSGGLVNHNRGNLVGGTANLGPLQNNGGPTFTMALNTGSAAINAGSNALAIDENGVALPFDQRGTGFPRIVGSAVDIGAYEVQNSGSVSLPGGSFASSSLIPATTVPIFTSMVTANVATPDFVDLSDVSSSSPDLASAVSAPFTPSQIRSAYGLNSTFFNSVAADGSGQTIAIIDAYNDPDIISDANSFSSLYGLPQFNTAGDPTLQVLNQTGTTSPLPVNANTESGNWDIEESLDVEWAHAIAPKANIILFEANSPDNSDLDAAIATAADFTGVSVVSMSFGGFQLYDLYGGTNETSTDSLFTTPAGHQGVTFLASTGDEGAAGVNYPALSPNVIAVGGTSLQIGSDGSYLGESAWDGGGGGVSIFEVQPTFQSGKVNGVTSAARSGPDVSMDADFYTGVEVQDSLSGGLIQIGGTSVAAPMWGGLVALIDQGRALKGESSLDGPSQTLPMLYNLSSSDFHDITTGNNGYPATIGYDLATGLGSPIANLLVPAMAGFGPADIWTGAQSNDWYNANNWSLDFVPIATTNVIINFGSPTASTAFTISDLTINGGTLLLGTGSGGSVSTSLTITGSGTLDVGNNHFIIDFSGTDPIATIRGYLTSGYTAGAWTGTGIDSSAVATHPGYSVGYGDGADHIISGITNGQIEIAFALVGDLNLDGLVNATDFSLFSANFNQNAAAWDAGDLTYDGVVNATDFGLLGSEFGDSATAAAATTSTPAATVATTNSQLTTVTTTLTTAAQKTVQAANISTHHSPPRRHDKGKRTA